MAETAVNILLGKLQKLLVSELEILRGVHINVKNITDQLELLNAFLNDADRQAEEGTSEATVVWVRQLRKVAFRMEDVVDRYLLKVAVAPQRDKGCAAFIKVIEKLKSLGYRHDIASEIGEIEKKIETLNKTRETTLRLQSRAAANYATANHGLGAHFVEESQLVGIHHNREELTNWLLASETKRSVRVEAGPPGIGKTTIVKNVCNRMEEMKNDVYSSRMKEINPFEYCAWITVSRAEDGNTLLRSILQKIHELQPNASAALRTETMDMESTINKLKAYLKDKRYLLVFDDVRELNFWDTVKYALADSSSKSSKVIIIARDEKVADCCRTDTSISVDVYKPQPLSQDHALTLFHHKVFPFEEKEVQYPELENLSKEFVRKCNGIPQIIIAIAGLLSTKEKTPTEWQRVNDQLGSLLENNHLLEVVQQVMSESYYDLPSHLMPFLLYFGLFPEDYSISCMRLIRLWVAEGFIKEEQETEDRSMEEVAKEYLDELFRRCLVQVSQVDFAGKPKSCYMHHLMHKFISNKCKGQSFCQVMEDKINSHKADPVLRRLSIHIKNNSIYVMERDAKWSGVRSCFVFDDAKKWLVTKSLLSTFELLIGLDLCGTHLDNLPKEVGNLLNLKYLNLRNTNIRSLPKSIGKLKKLQTLDLKQTRVRHLPEEIKKLIMLRHLLAYYVNHQHSSLNALQGVELKKGLQNLTSLQKLSFLEVNALSIIEELKQLKKLRKLGIIKLKEEYGEALCSAIESMTFLCSLSIGALENDKILMLQSLMHPPLSLERLYLYGRLQEFPIWIPKLEKLNRLYLKWSGLKEDPLPYLKDLSELLHLELYDTYGGDELHFKNGWFKALKFLHIESMPNLKTIKIDEGALPDLGGLKIGKCHQMVRMPSDVQNLMNLKKLYLYDMPQQIINGDFSLVRTTVLVLFSKDDHFVNFHDLDTLNETGKP
ncbi:Virus X resistance protein-like, coiled-coil domain [Sesbania bispinosa]|nr:Virus X resistance protein-like, coiled-coil domain [Sesbania bispinosa]